jgi:hypothetical protein
MSWVIRKFSIVGWNYWRPREFDPIAKELNSSERQYEICRKPLGRNQLKNYLNSRKQEKSLITKVNFYF